MQLVRLLGSSFWFWDWGWGFVSDRKLSVNIIGYLVSCPGCSSDHASVACSLFLPLSGSARALLLMILSVGGLLLLVVPLCFMFVFRVPSGSTPLLTASPFRTALSPCTWRTAKPRFTALMCPPSSLLMPQLGLKPHITARSCRLPRPHLEPVQGGLYVETGARHRTCGGLHRIPGPIPPRFEGDKFSVDAGGCYFEPS